MKIPPAKVKTSLEHRVASVKNDDELHTMKQRYWQDSGHLVIMAEQIAAMSNFYKMMIKAIGNILYGKRK